MLPLEQGGVVDANLRIYGLGNVRAVDASVFPLQFAAHMQWPVYSLAEQGAQMIRNFHNGVPNPWDPTTTPSGGNNNNNNNTNNNSGHHSGALSLSAPSVMTSAVALFLAFLVVVL